jgi:hypothetical protein
MTAHVYGRPHEEPAALDLSLWRTDRISDRRTRLDLTASPQQYVDRLHAVRSLLYTINL